MASLDDTWQFWVEFVFEDGMAYVFLFLAIRSGNWDLRLNSTKSMAAIFTAFDHPTYQRLISRHLEDIADIPAPLRTTFRQGAFVMSISGTPWHSVAIDEGHEMLINKDCKKSIIHPLPDYINRTAQYLPYRSKALKNLQDQLFPSDMQISTTIEGPFSIKPLDLKSEQNISAQIDTIMEAGVLSVVNENRGLLNLFTKKEANTAQKNDLLNFRLIGEKEFLQRISAITLKIPSIKAPNRKRRLQTLSERKITKSRVTRLEKDKKLIMTAMKKKICKTGQPVERPCEQLIELPLAISDSEGNPLKGQKSYTTHFLETRYKNTEPKVFLSAVPCAPECCLVEGMFVINTTPLGSHKTMVDYAKFLLIRFIEAQFRCGCYEVHVIFDNPDRLQNTPKYFEHLRRDKLASIQTNHCCDTITGTSKIPKKWREDLINCRECKRSLVKYLTQYFLHNVHQHLHEGQTLIWQVGLIIP